MRTTGGKLVWVVALAGLAGLAFDETGVAPSVDAADPAGPAVAPVTQSSTYRDLVLGDEPIAYFAFDGSTRERVAAESSPANAAAKLVGSLIGTGQLGTPGPRAPRFPRFAPSNAALDLEGLRGFVKVADPGENSPLDFQLGDALTLEAWVRPHEIPNDQQIYVVGKGRTNNPGQKGDNQNYALRLRGVDGTARLSFLFRSEQGGPDGKPAFHRWNSSSGFPHDSGWHHVAVTYEFGRPESMRGYIDGQPVVGTWDYAGPTAKPPVVDNDDLWIGSSMGGSAAATFVGGIDEVAIYRRALAPERIAARFERLPGDDPAPAVATPELPRDGALVHWYEGLAEKSWNLERAELVTTTTLPVLAVLQTPRRYDSRGLPADWRGTILARTWAQRELPAGEYRLLVRARHAVRLFVDDRQVLQTKFLDGNGDGHEAVPALAASENELLHPLPPAHQEQLVTVRLEAGAHRFRLDALVGGKRFRPETGEILVAIAGPTGDFQLLTADEGPRLGLTEAEWIALSTETTRRMTEADAARRRSALATDDEYWSQRHARARERLAALPPIPVPADVAEYSSGNAIDRFLARRLAAAHVAAPPLLDDYEFARRTSLDLIGVVPSRRELTDFNAESTAAGNDPQARQAVRKRWVDRLLADDRWADHWVSYWQDVLAENPGILKPEQNNTGPFRWWLHEALLDNRPFDRFVTELLLMEGSKQYGGPAGFAMASQNDAPMAAKAQIAMQAFLGLEMKCARCHDAPYHPYTQQELFSLAAMLGRQPIAIPKASTVGEREGGRKPLVTMSLKAGDVVAAKWNVASLPTPELFEGLVRRSDDTREQLAALLTSPTNDRFAHVLVNRVWKRMLGWGIVEPVDDWSNPQPADPQVLDWLARQFVASGYDVKHVARLIAESHTYQRQALRETPIGLPAEPKWWSAPLRKRLSAEQLVDSAYAVAGKALDTEPLTMDPEGRRPVDTFLNLGVPTRAWHMTSLSNERDRPALALPRAQQVVDLLVAFGWRDARPNGQTVRDESATFLQPLTLANGVAATRLTRLSDESQFTALALEDLSVHQLVDQLFLQVLSRPPRSSEREAFVTLLEPGFGDRRVPGAKPAPIRPRMRHAVSWSNHLNAEATRIKQQLERETQAGDPPTKLLAADWRERLEDAAWALLNSPEFLFVP